MTLDDIDKECDEFLDDIAKRNQRYDDLLDELRDLHDDLVKWKIPLTTVETILEGIIEQYA